MCGSRSDLIRALLAAYLANDRDTACLSNSHTKTACRFGAANSPVAMQLPRK